MSNQTDNRIEWKFFCAAASYEDTIESNGLQAKIRLSAVEQGSFYLQPSDLLEFQISDNEFLRMAIKQINLNLGGSVIGTQASFINSRINEIDIDFVLGGDVPRLARSQPIGKTVRTVRAQDVYGQSDHAQESRGIIYGTASAIRDMLLRGIAEEVVTGTPRYSRELLVLRDQYTRGVPRLGISQETEQQRRRRLANEMMQDNRSQPDWQSRNQGPINPRENPANVLNRQQAEEIAAEYQKPKSRFDALDFDDQATEEIYEPVGAEWIETLDVPEEFAYTGEAM